MRKLMFALPCILLLFFAINATALSAPNVSSPNYPNSETWYIPTNAIVLSWGEVEDATAYYYEMTPEPGTVPTLASESTTETSVEYKKVRDVWYFHVRAAKGNTLSETTHFRIRLDSRNPSWSERTPLSAVATPEGNIKITWSSAVDEQSGIDHYRLHRDRFFDFDFRDAPVKYSPVLGTSYVDTNGMSESKTYFYQIVAVDTAGNLSTISNRASATTMAFCDINVSFDVALSGDEQSLVISIDADGNLYSGALEMFLPNDTAIEFFNNTTFADYITEFDLSETNEGRITLDLYARERLGDDCSISKEFIYDVTDPTVEIISPELNENVLENITVNVRAVDNGDFKSGIEKVEFFVRTESWESLGLMSAGENDVYSIDWNTFNFSNGRHQLKVVASDAVGNSAEASSGAIVLNTLYQRGDANAAIDEAVVVRQEAFEFIDSMKKRNVFSDSIDEILASAEEELSKAKQAYSKGGNEYTNALTNAKSAQDLFQSIEAQLVLESFGEQAFVYNKEQAGILLNASPLDRGFLQEAELLIEAASPQRKIVIIKVIDDNDTYFRANVVMTFSVSPNYLNENDLNFLRLIEFIPKELAPGASDIYSFYDFSVLNEDPAIEFKADKGLIALGEMSYGLNKDLTEDEANALLTANVANKYVVPPILVSNKAKISVGGFEFDVPQLPIDLPLEILFVAVLVIVAVIVIAVVMFKHKKKKKSKRPDLSIFE